MLRRPWPPLYRHRSSFNYPDFQYYAPLQSSTRDKGRDYYFLAPLYRNALPPPPPPPPLNMPPRRLLIQPSQCSCPCLHRTRSRSLDNVRSDEEDDHYQTRSRRHHGKENHFKRRSMENLLETRPTRRRGRPVRIGCVFCEVYVCSRGV